MVKFMTRPFRALHALSLGKYRFEDRRTRWNIAVAAIAAIVAFSFLILFLAMGYMVGVVGNLVLYLAFAGITEFAHNQSRKKVCDENRPPDWEPAPLADTGTIHDSLDG